MEAEDQKAGERRVRALLVDPLVRRGLGKPAHLTRDQFEAMQEDLCQRLAYMAPDMLAALEEHAAASPSGKDKDRFPIGNQILEWAAQFQPPEESASPLMRAVFAHRLGRDAMAEGWAPELLFHLRRVRRWPGAFEIRKMTEEGRALATRLADIEMRLARDGEVRQDEAEFRARRRAALERCAAISAAVAA